MRPLYPKCVDIKDVIPRYQKAGETFRLRTSRHLWLQVEATVMTYDQKPREEF